MGRRVQKTVYSYEADSYQLTANSVFLYDGWNLIKETMTPEGGAQTAKHYIWGLDLSQSLQGAGGVGGLLAVITNPDGDFDSDGDVDGSDLALLANGSETLATDLFASLYGRQRMSVGYYLYDGNGNVGQVIDEAGTIVAHYEYDPFGKLVGKSGHFADENLFRFSSKYFDQETGLYYYGYRYYLPSFGRWINRDPIEELGSVLLRQQTKKKQIDLNLYAFVQNSPMNQIDPLGLTIGFGFSGRFAIFGLSFERVWDQCCKDSNVLIKRSIAKNCWMMGVGLSAKIKVDTKGFSPSLGGNCPNEGHCGEKEWVVEIEHKYGGDLIIYGRDSKSGNKWLPLGLGGYYDLYTYCRYTVDKEEAVGCCNKE